MANSGYYTEPKLNATGGGSSLTIREADGTPSGVVTELVFPNTSVSIASGVGTLSVVPLFDTSITGGRNAFIVEPPPVAGQQANFLFESHSGPSGDDFGIARILANAEEGIQLVAKGNGGSDPSYNLSILPTGYAVTQASNFRTAIDAAASSHTHGNISNAGAIGSTADLPISTTASGVINTRTVADFRGLLGLATTDSPTFAGVTLGTSGILVGGTNRIEQRNGTNAQILEIAKTWSSTTVFEELTIDAASDASNYRIGSRIGSAGGTTRGLQLGAYNAAGAWTSWLSFDSSGVPTFSTNGNLSVANGGVNAFALSATQRIRIGSGVTFETTTSGVTTIGYLGFAASNATGGPDMAFTRISNTSIEVNNGTAGTVRDLSMRDITLVPSASRTLSTNGQFSIEMTSNTAGNLVYRGSDGTTRRMALTFS